MLQKILLKSRLLIGQELEMLASDWSRGPSENFQRRYPYDPDILTSVMGALKQNSMGRAHSVPKGTHLDRCRYTGREHSIRIPRGGRTQSDYVPKRTYRVNFCPPPTPRGGTTESELYVAGQLNQNSTWRDNSIRIPRGGITQSDYII